MRNPIDDVTTPAVLTRRWAMAIQALAKGHATPGQQVEALDWIVQQVARTFATEYRTDPHDHAFCSGRRFCGSQIIAAINSKPEELPDA